MSDPKLLSDEQCAEFRRLPCSFNDMVRNIHTAGYQARQPEIDGLNLALSKLSVESAGQMSQFKREIADLRLHISVLKEQQAETLALLATHDAEIRKAERERCAVKLTPVVMAIRAEIQRRMAQTGKPQLGKLGCVERILDVQAEIRNMPDAANE